MAACTFRNLVLPRHLNYVNCIKLQDTLSFEKINPPPAIYLHDTVSKIVNHYKSRSAFCSKRLLPSPDYHTAARPSLSRTLYHRVPSTPAAGLILAV